MRSYVRAYCACTLPRACVLACVCACMRACSHNCLHVTGCAFESTCTSARAHAHASAQFHETCSKIICKGHVSCLSRMYHMFSPFSLFHDTSTFPAYFNPQSRGQDCSVCNDWHDGRLRASASCWGPPYGSTLQIISSVRFSFLVCKSCAVL